MKIYVATSGEYSSYGIDAVFVTKRKAEIYCAVHGCRLEEYESHDESIEENDQVVLYRYDIREDQLSRRYASYNYVLNRGYQVNHVRDDKYYGLIAEIYLNKPSQKKALQIARDMIAQYRSENVMSDKQKLEIYKFAGYANAIKSAWGNDNAEMSNNK